MATKKTAALKTAAKKPAAPAKKAAPAGRGSCRAVAKPIKDTFNKSSLLAHLVTQLTEFLGENRSDGACPSERTPSPATIHTTFPGPVHLRGKDALPTRSCHAKGLLPPEPVPTAKVKVRPRADLWLKAALG
jgi:hypothetical protein